ILNLDRFQMLVASALALPGVGGASLGNGHVSFALSCIGSEVKFAILGQVSRVVKGRRPPAHSRSPGTLVPVMIATGRPDDRSSLTGSRFHGPPVGPVASGLCGSGQTAHGQRSVLSLPRLGRQRR